MTRKTVLRIPGRTGSQNSLLSVLDASGPMWPHALVWKSGLPERRAQLALAGLILFGDAELVRGLVTMTDRGRLGR